MNSSDGEVRQSDEAVWVWESSGIGGVLGMERPTHGTHHRQPASGWSSALGQRGCDWRHYLCLPPWPRHRRLPQFPGELSPLRNFAGIIHGTLQLSGRAIIQFGLLLLIATPVARVIFSAVAFAWERDYLYVAFTLAVLAVLTLQPLRWQSALM